MKKKGFGLIGILNRKEEKELENSPECASYCKTAKVYI